MTGKKRETAFHKIARSKGWKLVDIGKRWGIKERQMSRIANKPSRKDLDAVKGLPSFGDIEEEENSDRLVLGVILIGTPFVVWIMGYFPAGAPWEQAEPQGIVEAYCELLVALSIVGQLALLVFIIGQSTERKVRELSSLRWIEPANELDECITLGKWHKKDETVRAYLDKVEAQGRKPVMGEYEAAENWMAEAEQRAKIEKARQACERMGVV